MRDEGPRDGPVVVFANSLGTDLRIWDQVISALPEGLRIIRYDKRGHGLSDLSPTAMTIDDLAGDAEALMDALGVQGATFVGLSIGGLIGQALAAKRPDLVGRLALMDTAAKIGSAEMWNERILAVRESGIEGMADGILARWFGPGFRTARADEYAIWRNMLTRTPLEGYLACCAAIAAADYTTSTAKLAMPVMAMVGAEDGATPPDLVRATAELCGADCHVIGGAGHLPCVEEPGEIAALIAGFMNET